MNHDKKNIIIKEIYYWKNSKLLPETYCDFLLALYTEGNHVEYERTSLKNKKTNGLTTFQGLLFGFLLLLLPITLLVIYFTELSFVLQMIIVGFCLVGSIAITSYFIRKRSLFQVPLSLTLIQLFIVSVVLVEYLTSGDRLWIGGIIVANCLFWIITGRFYRILYLLISGVVGLSIFVMKIIF